MAVPELGAARNQHVSPQVELPLEDPKVEPFLDAFLPALNRHLDEEGWKPIYLQHVLDEPHGDEPAAYARVAALAKEHLPGVPTVDAIDAHDSTRSR